MDITLTEAKIMIQSSIISMKIDGMGKSPLFLAMEKIMNHVDELEKQYLFLQESNMKPGKEL